MERPATNSLLRSEQAESFATNGFLTFEHLVSDGELRELKKIIEDLFQKRAGEKEGAHLDLVAPGKPGTTQTSPQITNPVNYAPRLHQAQFFQNALAIAKQLLGEKARCLWDFAILKTPENGAPTPWHQDEASRDPNFEYTELTIWIALQDTSVENGCLRFIPGSNRTGVFDHGFANDDPSCHALQCVHNFDVDAAVACPLRAGDCTIHHPRILHCSSPNISARPRFGYILVFGLAPRPVDTHRTFPWLQERHTIAQERRRKWMRRGGLVVMMWRKMRRREVPDWPSAKYALKRSLEVLHSGR
ncbi:MAG: phytanoyl-CoA dioxygenase family protein [Candidatus Acidiferrum sp.]